MKSITGYLILTLVCTSCRRPADSTQVKGALTSAQVSKLVKERYRGYRFNFEIRGPLDFKEYKKGRVKAYETWAEHMRDVNRPAGTFEDSGVGRTCARFEAELKEGGELYFYRSEGRSWSELDGAEGYVLIRDGKIIDLMETAMS